MKIFHLHTRQVVDRSLDEVFDFFSRAENLEAITPSWLHFSIVSEHDLTMGEGLTIDYQLRMRGIPLRWQSEITAWQPPHCFVDEQRRGPYQRWHHVHRFHARGHHTIVEDHVEYAAPLGALLNRWFLVPQLRTIFEHRQNEVAKRFSNVEEARIFFGDEARELRSAALSSASSI